MSKLGAITRSEMIELRRREKQLKCKDEGKKAYLICKHPYTVKYFRPNDPKLERKISDSRDRILHPQFNYVRTQFNPTII